MVSLKGECLEYVFHDKHHEWVLRDEYLGWMVSSTVQETSLLSEFGYAIGVNIIDEVMIVDYVSVYFL